MQFFLENDNVQCGGTSGKYITEQLAPFLNSATRLKAIAHHLDIYLDFTICLFGNVTFSNTIYFSTYKTCSNSVNS